MAKTDRQENMSNRLELTPDELKTLRFKAGDEVKYNDGYPASYTITGFYTDTQWSGSREIYADLSDGKGGVPIKLLIKKSDKNIATLGNKTGLVLKLAKEKPLI